MTRLFQIAIAIVVAMFMQSHVVNTFNDIALQLNNVM